MELRDYLDVLKRNKWFVVEAVVLVALIVGITSRLRTPVYRATAQVLLEPNDPSEQLRPGSAPRSGGDPDRYVNAQRQIAGSPAVIREAARSLRGMNPQAIRDSLSVTERRDSDVLEISATAVDPPRARDIANAVANAYIEHRRRSAVEGLQRAVNDITPRLTDLQARIAELDDKIAQAAGGTATTAVRPPDNPATEIDGPTSLAAARDAAVVQYENLYGRQQELLVDMSLKRGEAETIAEAEVPGAPASPRPTRDAALGGFMGLVVGVGIALLRDRLDDRLRSVADIERATGLPVLAELPFDPESGRGAFPVAAIAWPRGSLAEAVRSLRTSIIFQRFQSPVKVIVVASPSAGDGKSTVAANLAAVSAQAGYRTFLVSADLRRPTPSSWFDNSGDSPGITDIVSGAAAALDGNAANDSDLDDVLRREIRQRLSLGVVRTELPFLRVIPPGPVPSNPSELLGSRSMRVLLEELAAQAELVIVDTAAILPVTDGAVLAAEADGVVLVTAMGETRREAARRATKIVQATGTRILGVVANKLPMSPDFRYPSKRTWAPSPPGSTALVGQQPRLRQRGTGGHSATAAKSGER
ncbi:MAG: polysaccharide biosynthesis tyrosine autokinase [Acidimicrobiales bacterium]